MFKNNEITIKKKKKSKKIKEVLAIRWTFFDW